MNDKIKALTLGSSEPKSTGEQTVEEATAKLDAAKDVGKPLSETEAKIADSNRAPVLEAITSLDKSTKGATAAIFNVMRSSVSASEAEVILMHLEHDWKLANENVPIPASWKSTKSPMLKLFNGLPQLIKDAKVALDVVLTRDGVHDKDERARRAAILFLDDDAKLQPLAFGPKGYSDWKNALSALSKNVAASKVAGKSKSDKAPETIEEYDTTGFAPEVLAIRQRILRAIKAANGVVPHPELIGLMQTFAVSLEKRTEVTRQNRKAA